MKVAIDFERRIISLDAGQGEVYILQPPERIINCVCDYTRIHHWLYVKTTRQKSIVIQYDDTANAIRAYSMMTALKESF